jgi:hypothetical protein
MMGGGSAIHNDRCRGELVTIVMHGCLVVVREEHDRHSFRTNKRTGHSRHTFAAVLHPQPAQINLRQFGAEAAFRGDQ